MSLQDYAIQAFKSRFRMPPAMVVRAPGRVNLIGEHTDYNDGFVLPIAIDRAIWIALQQRHDDRVVVHSLNVDQTADFSLRTFASRNGGWIEYLKGVAWALKKAGHTLTGWEGVVASNVPIGAGLSSSAALELATARAFAIVSQLPWEPAAMARIGQQAENAWVGMNCGIMDQMICAAGQADHALLIDCRTLETALVPLPPDTAVVVLDTATRRSLVDSAYNERRTQCEAAARFFGVPTLRDVRVDQLGTLQDDLMHRRARHVVTENVRTQQAAEVMRRGDAVALGQLMNASHASLRDDFSVSSNALNAIVRCAREQGGCYGARMTGAGFGGCAIALVHAEKAEIFSNAVADSYFKATGLTATIYICQVTSGAQVVWKGDDHI